MSSTATPSTAKGFWTLGAVLLAVTITLGIAAYFAAQYFR